MKIDVVVAKFTQVHREYQLAGGFEDGDSVSPESKPLADLEGFESDFIPEIVRKVARELGHPFEKGDRVHNIYVDNGRKLNLREIANAFNKKYCAKWGMV